MVKYNGIHMLFQLFWLQQPFITTYLCSNNWISWTNLITLVNACDLEHCVAWGVSMSIWKQWYYFQVEGGSDLSYKNVLLLTLKWIRPPKHMGTYCSDTSTDFWSLKYLVIVINQQNTWNWWSDTVIVFLWFSNEWESESPIKIWAIDALTLLLIIQGVSNNLA